MNLKFNARVVLILIVGIVALSYVIDFLNPLTPDPPAILRSLQWQLLVSFIVSILAWNFQRLVLIRLRHPLPEIPFSRLSTSPPAPADRSFILALTCSRLI